jgi:hypothetical protein
MNSQLGLPSTAGRAPLRTAAPKSERRTIGLGRACDPTGVYLLLADLQIASSAARNALFSCEAGSKSLWLASSSTTATAFSYLPERARAWAYRVKRRRWLLVNSMVLTIPARSFLTLCCRSQA